MNPTAAVMHRDETMSAAAIQPRHLHLVRAEAAAGTAFGHASDEIASRSRWPVLALGTMLAVISAGAAVAGTLAYAL